jgi:dipeptidyl aminopeptidase/acylaminoacyl peptidase
MFHDWSDSSWNKVSREIMRHRIGNESKDAPWFAEVSPLQHAASIKAPVLLMHGDFDRRVPISHAEKMKQALERNNKSVEWEVFEEAGHGLVYVKDQQRYYKRLLDFLARHLKPE